MFATGRLPSKTPLTVVIPATVTSPSLALTAVTLAARGVAEFIVVNFKILPTFTFDMNLLALGDVTLATLELSPVIDEIPILTKVSNTVSAVNTFEAPIAPKSGPP